MASKDYKIGLDNEEFKRKLRETQQMVTRNKLIMERDLNIKMTDLQEKAQRAVTEETKRTTDALREGGQETTAITHTLGRAGKLMAGLFTVREAGRFIGAIASVRGEFQKLEISFNTMLKSQEKASALMAQLTETATKTPFDLQSITMGAKQLLAYGVEADKLNDKLLTLGDIAAGLSIPLGDLVYLYGTTMTQGRMYAMDLRQFMGRGVPLAEELARQFGVATSEIQKMVSEGKVGAKEFDQAIESLRASRFKDLMAQQAKSIPGQMEALRDGVQLALNEMGKASEGAFKRAIEGATYLVEHYKEVGSILGFLISTYGAYRAAIIAYNVAQSIATSLSKGYTIATQAQYTWLLMVEKAQKLLNATMLKNPYVLAGTALLSLVSAVVLFRDGLSEAERAQKRHNEETERQNKLMEENKQKADALLRTIQDETATRYQKNRALAELQKLYPSIFAQMDIEQVKQAEYLALQSQINTANDEGLKLMKEKAMLQAREREREAKAEYDAVALTAPDATVVQSRLRAYQRAVEDRKQAERDYYSYSAQLAESKLTETEKQQRAEARLTQLQRERATLLKQTTKAQPPLLEAQRDGGGFAFDDPVQELRLKAIDKAIEEVQASLKKADEAKPFATLQDTLKEVNKEVTTLEAKLKSLRDGTATGVTDWVKEIEETEKALKEAKDKRDTLQGSDVKQKPTAPKQVERSIVEKRAAFEARVQEETRGQADAIALMEVEGLEAIEAKYYQTLQNINKQKEAFIKEYNATQLQADALYYDQLRQAEQVRVIEEEVYYKSLLEKHATYLQQKEAIEAQAERDRRELRAYAHTTGSDVSGNIQEVNEQERADIEALNLAFAMKQEEFESWVNRVADLSLQALEEQLERAKALLISMEGQIGVDPEALAKQSARVQVLQERLKSNVRHQGDRTTKDWQKLYQTLRDVGAEFTQLGEEIGGVFGELIADSGAFAQSSIMMIDGIITLATGSIQTVETVSKSAETAIRAVESASVILAISGAALELLGTISRWVTKNTDLTKEQREEYQSMIQVTHQLTEANMRLMESLSSEELQRKYKETADIIKESLTASRDFINDFLNSGASAGFLGIGSKASEGVQLRKRLQDYRHELERVTGESWAKLVGSGRMEGMANLSVEQIRAISQNALLWSKLGDQMQSVYNNILESHEQLNELDEKRLQNLTSTTKEQLQDDLLDFLDDLDSGMEAPAETFERSMKNAMKRVLRDNTIAKEMDNYYKKFAEANRDGLITAGELNDLKTLYFDMVERARREWDVMTSVFGDTMNDPREATENALTSASQDSVDELVGLWHTSVQIQSQRDTKATVYEETMRDLQHKVWQEVHAIRLLTEKIDRATASIDTNIKDISTTGLRVI